MDDQELPVTFDAANSDTYERPIARRRAWTVYEIKLHVD